MTDIQVIDPLKFTEWDELLRSNPRSGFFHTTAWARVLSETYRYKPSYFCICHNRRLTALIPLMEIDSIVTGRRGVSLPFTDFNQSFAENEKQMTALLHRIAQHGRNRGWKFVEYRGRAENGHQLTPASHFWVHVLELDKDDKAVFKIFKSNNRRNIKRAQNADIQVELSTSYQAMRSFYQLNCLTRRHHGLPPQPWRFFANVHRHIIDTGKGFVCLARHKNNPIAASVYFHDDTTTIYKYGASDRAYLNMRPNNLVMWKAIQWSCRQGMKHFHFGRTEPSHSGLMQFKRSWGAKEKQLEYYKYDFKKQAYLTQSSGPESSYPIFRHLPLPLLRLSGSLLYRHIG